MKRRREGAEVLGLQLSVLSFRRRGEEKRREENPKNHRSTTRMGTQSRLNIYRPGHPAREKRLVMLAEAARVMTF